MSRISPPELLANAASALGLGHASRSLGDDALLAALLRRAAGSHCPCTSATLVATVFNCLVPVSDAPELRERLELVTNDLIVLGDLLELDQVTIDSSDLKGTWVFLGPPGFVRRPHGGVILSGLSPDEITPLPASLANQVQYEGVARLLESEPNQDRSAVLHGLGFVEIPAERWLRAPKLHAPDAVINDFHSCLVAQPASGAIPDLQILDPTRRVTHYRQRWNSPTGQTGDFVARRPRAYGAPIWGLVRLESGSPRRFLDFPLTDYPFRGCDTAWYLQMAIDAHRGIPQRYRIRGAKDGACFDFFSPLPLWAGRRLRILGRSIPASGCLATYFVPSKELEAEEQFLRRNLWMTPID